MEDFKLQDLLKRRTYTADKGLITIDIEDDGSISNVSLVLEPDGDSKKVREALSIIQKHLEEWVGKD